VQPVVLPHRCPHGNLPYGNWANTVPPMTRWQISCPCCMWYEQAENETCAVKMWNEYLRQNAGAKLRAPSDTDKTEGVITSPPATCSAKTYPHNPSHPIGTCTKCGGEMVYNVPRMGPNGGFVHKATGRLVCGTGRCDACGGDRDNADCPELAEIMRRYSPNATR
jgi:hypothetical protein